MTKPLMQPPGRSTSHTADRCDHHDVRCDLHASLNRRRFGNDSGCLWRGPRYHRRPAPIHSGRRLGRGPHRPRSMDDARRFRRANPVPHRQWPETTLTPCLPLYNARHMKSALVKIASSVWKISARIEATTRLAGGSCHIGDMGLLPTLFVAHKKPIFRTTSSSQNEPDATDQDQARRPRKVEIKPG